MPTAVMSKDEFRVTNWSKFAWTFPSFNIEYPSLRNFFNPWTNRYIHPRWDGTGCGILERWEGSGVHTGGRLQKVQIRMHQQKVEILPWKVRDMSCVAVAGEETGRSHQWKPFWTLRAKGMWLSNNWHYF